MSKNPKQEKMMLFLKKNIESIFGEQVYYVQSKTMVLNGVNLPKHYIFSIVEPIWCIVFFRLLEQPHETLNFQINNFLRSLKKSTVRNKMTSCVMNAIKLNRDLNIKLKTILPKINLEGYLHHLLLKEPCIIVIVEINDDSSCLAHNLLSAKMVCKGLEVNPSILAFNSSKSAMEAFTPLLVQQESPYLTRSEFEMPILETINDVDGSCRTKDILMNVENKLRQNLAEGDYQIYKNGVPRWHKQAEWALHNLKVKNFIKHGQTKGLWELTPIGKKHLFKKNPINEES